MNAHLVVMLSSRLACSCLIAVLAGSQLRAATYEVAQRAPEAADDGPGSTERPWKTLARAAQAVHPGDVVLIRDGTYREHVVIQTSGTEQSPIRFEAARGADVVLSGADRLTAWVQPDPGTPVYRTAWPYRFITWSPHMTHPDDTYHRLIGRCEQVAINGYPLGQVLEAGQLAPGAFYADTSNQVLNVWDPAGRDLNQVLVEASVRQEILRVEGAYVQVRGLRFRYAANMAQHGSVVLAGAHDVLEDCVLESMNSSGATFTGEDQIVRRCTFRDNGQIGFGANGAHRLLFTECLVENNNTKGFDRGWEAGGDKLVLSRDVVLERSRFVRNRGNGIWFDIGNEQPTVRQCLIADNEDSGIFYEISFGLQARDNVIVGNGFAATAGAWGAQAGIALSSSPGCVIERNLILGNREGFNFREQDRTTPRIGQHGEAPVWNHDELIQHNLIAFNRDAQIWGWFDTRDGRQWPATGKTNGAEPRNSVSGRDSQDGNRAATGLTLESLHLLFKQNTYCAGPGQGWFNWGTTWGRHATYASLRDFQSALRLDSGGRTAEPAFADLLARDYRLPRSDLSRFQEDYPRGPVPGVRLGVRP